MCATNTTGILPHWASSWMYLAQAFLPMNATGGVGVHLSFVCVCRFFLGRVMFVLYIYDALQSINPIPSRPSFHHHHHYRRCCHYHTAHANGVLNVCFFVLFCFVASGGRASDLAGNVAPTSHFDWTVNTDIPDTVSKAWRHRRSVTVSPVPFFLSLGWSRDSCYILRSINSTN